MAESLPNTGRLVSKEIKNLFRDKLDEMTADLGRVVTLHLKPIVVDCPNCGFNDITKRSNRKYNASNPETLNGPKHKVFIDGQVCPVCNDQGILRTPRSAQYTSVISKRFREQELLEAGIGKIDKHLVKTLTVLGSYSDVVECDSASIDGEIYTKIGKCIKTGLHDLIRVRQFWVRSE